MRFSPVIIHVPVPSLLTRRVIPNGSPVPVDFQRAFLSRAITSLPPRASRVIYIIFIRSQNRVTNFLVFVTQNSFSSNAMRRRRFRETRRDRIALSRGTGMSVDARGGVSPKVPAGLESTRRTGSGYRDTSPTRNVSRTEATSRGGKHAPLRRNCYTSGRTIVNGSWRANSDTRRTRIAAPRERVTRSLPARGFVKFPVR